jgi:hypothetical protein
MELEGRLIKWGTAVLVLVVSVFGALYFWLGQYMERQFGAGGGTGLSIGGYNSISYSTEPYDLIFNWALSGASETKTKVLSWHLRIPRNFVFDERGYNASIGNTSSYIASIGAVLSNKSGLLDPWRVEDSQGSLQVPLTIRLSNRPDAFQEDIGNRCISGEELELMTGIKAIPCSKSTNCRLLISNEGWTGEMYVSPKYYQRREEVCRAVHSFLVDHTIKIDKLSP